MIIVYDLPFEAANTGPESSDCICCQKALKQLYTHSCLRMGDYVNTKSRVLGSETKCSILNLCTTTRVQHSE